MKKWWQGAIIYQVYIRSFKDGNGDGIGDFIGLTSKLDYLKDLGINAIWVSPHYDSPMDDNGYDIRDYFKVSQDYGSIEDAKTFIEEAHKRGIKVIFDLVLNHTSDEHPWFEAAKDPNHKDHEKYHDYYIWQKPKYNKDKERMMPTRWRSWFGGPVWEYNEATDEYYLHIFSKKMPDLNWRNENMKQDLKDMAKWWIDLGVDGFRVDASNHLEKNWDFPDAHPGYEHFSSLPKHHSYLEEFGLDVFGPSNVMTMGEAGGASKEEAIKYVGYDNNEFDMLIHFGAAWADCDDDNQITPGKWAKGTLNVASVKETFQRWHTMLQGEGQNLVYWHNHDHPRIISHYGNDEKYHNESGKMLCYSMYLMPGTMICYQGEEIGMTNVDYDVLEDFRDVEVFTEYQNFMELGASHEVAMQALRDRSRDNARSPFQWDSSPYAGFSENQPWMNVVGNYKTINLEDEMQDESSIYQTYKEVFALRKEWNLDEGSLRFLDLENKDSYVYENKAQDISVLVVANFKDTSIQVELDIDTLGYVYCMGNSEKKELQKTMDLGPYEALVYCKK
jgi:glycosidase